jgi:hypothetical protein
MALGNCVFTINAKLYFSYSYQFFLSLNDNYILRKLWQSPNLKCPRAVAERELKLHKGSLKDFATPTYIEYANSKRGRTDILTDRSKMNSL